MLVFVLLISVFCLSNDKVTVFSDSSFKEMKINKKDISKTLNGKEMKLRFIIGQSIEGKITSIEIESLDGSKKVNEIINLEEFKSDIKDFIHTLRYDNVQSTYGGVPVSVKPSCYDSCTKKWDCFNKPTEAGVFLCAEDCFIECYLITVKQSTSLNSN